MYVCVWLTVNGMNYDDVLLRHSYSPHLCVCCAMKNDYRRWIRYAAFWTVRSESVEHTLNHFKADDKCKESVHFSITAAQGDEEWTARKKITEKINGPASCYKFTKWLIEEYHNKCVNCEVASPVASLVALMFAHNFRYLNRQETI